MHVVVVWAHLDSRGRAPAELLQEWRDFGRPLAEAMAAAPGLRLSMVHAAWQDDRRDVLGMDCHFVREPVPRIVLPGGRSFRPVPRRLLEQVRSLQPDLVHFEGLLFPRELRALAQVVPGVPIVAQDHGSKLPAWWRRPLWRWGFRPLAGVMFTARSQASRFTESGILPSAIPVYEVLEGSSPFTPGDRAAARAETGVTGDPALLWLGNLDANKDPLTVLDAVAIAAETLPGLRLYMCYRHAPLLPLVRQRLRDPRLAGRVILVGEVPYPGTEPWLRSADFVVQASHDEGSGFALIEAFACGATPLVTDIPSFRRITGDGRFGALVPVENPPAFSRAIVEWSARDRSVQRREARAHFDQSLSFGTVGRELSAAYQAAVR